MTNATRLGEGTLHVKDIDAVTSKQEVTETLESKVGKRNVMHE